MKQAIGYCRISTSDQSNYSISGQMDDIRRYCEQKEMVLMNIFTDEGQSAKNFDRANWKELEAFVRKNHKGIDYLIIWKYDRFSRNLSEALSMITQLETVYNILILSVLEPIDFPLDSPYYFKFRTDMLLDAHVERLKIKDRTRFGINKGKKEGRYLNKAPFGYINARDAQGKPIITIDGANAIIVRFIFETFIAGSTLSEVRRMAKEKGFPQKGKDAVYRILNNVTYCGKIEVKEYRGIPAHNVPGLHAPIINEETFWRAQALLHRPDLPKRQHNETAYLKGYIHCPHCYRPLTCGKSKGRNKYYWYYECTTHRKSFNMDKAHAAFLAILDELSLTMQQIEKLQQMVKGIIEEHINRTLGDLSALTDKKEKLKAKIESLSEKYIEDKLDEATYKKYNIKFNNEIAAINSTITSLSKGQEAYWSNYHKAFARLHSLRYTFEAAPLATKTSLVKIGFGKQLTYDGSTYRTTFLNPLFTHKELVLNNKNLLKTKISTTFSGGYPLGDANESPTEHIFAFLNFLNSIAA